MRVLQKDASGDDVRQWQAFLFGMGHKSVLQTGRFDDATDKATREFQRLSGLKPDGVAGPNTFSAAIRRGLPVVAPAVYPRLPAFSYPNSSRVRALFGEFKFVRLAGGSVQILGGWAQQNIVKIYIPQLVGREGAPADGMVYFHKRGAKQLQALFNAWERAGLLKYVKSWAGSFVQRMVRGSATQLSNHAWGSAFDINAAWNGLGKTPAAREAYGTVIPLVALANAHGFFWGGHYNSRRDGMHFELAALDMFPAETFADLRDDEIDDVLQIPTHPAAKIDQPAVSPSDACFAAAREAGDTNAPGNSPSLNPPLNPSENGSDTPPDTTPTAAAPIGDAPTAPASTFLNVEDWKPFVVRWLGRVWGFFTGGNVLQAGLLKAAALYDAEHWYVYAGVGALVFLALFFVALLATGGLVWFFIHNRKEIAAYIKLSKDSFVNPNSYNLGLKFEKK